jgi:hypothetical protein
MVVERMHGGHDACIERIKRADMRLAGFGNESNTIRRNATRIISSCSAPDRFHDFGQATIEGAKLLRPAPVHGH